MDNKATLSPEELDSTFPPADPAKYDEWNDYQNVLADKEADDPSIPTIPHEVVMQEMRDMLRQLEEDRERERNAA